MTAGDPEPGREDVRRNFADDAPTAAGGPPIADDRYRSARGEFLPGTVLAGRYRIVSLLRAQRPLRVGLVLALSTLLLWPAQFSGFSAIGIACTVPGVIAMLWAVRIGLVCFLALWFCLGVWMNFPVTTRLDAPHFGIGLAGVLIIAGVAAYGAFTAALPRASTTPRQPR